MFSVFDDNQKETSDRSISVYPSLRNAQSIYE